MNANNPGLYNAIDFVDDEKGSDEAENHAESLVAQAAGISLVCSLAMDSIAADGGGEALQADDVLWPISRLLFKCYDDLTVAANLMS